MDHVGGRRGVRGEFSHPSFMPTEEMLIRAGRFTEVRTNRIFAFEKEDGAGRIDSDGGSRAGRA